ncbi:MAG: thioredoxin domain-containing protein [Myxococcota bacterium]|nr:thioredoxin domain-containing protein [Myxococcota bacterium]
MADPTTHNSAKRSGKYALVRLLVLSTLLMLPGIALASAGAAKDSFRSPPGAPEFSKPLQKELSAALIGRGPDYEPRTRNLNPDGSPIYSNRLLLEASPYLQQHAHNPVNWYPWGNEAFAEAKRRGVPVLVSIGYSTCHWCHVMEEESFDDPETAKLLNEGFIAIKVDREARPDIDSVYMRAVQAMGISGGWPLNVWVTPDRVPFYGGTYFPPAPIRDRPSFRQILQSIRQRYAQDPKRFEELADTVARELSAQLSGKGTLSSSSPGISDLKRAAETYGSLADDQWGGIRQRVKFPSSIPVPFLLRWHERSGDKRSLAVATKSLDAMAAGGIHDQLAGGFHRYSTDSRWLVPHFEKMLYDQALLSNAYLEAWQKTGRPEYARVTRSILDYVASELQAPAGGFYSATDADSVRPDGEMEEGFFFTWTPSEVNAVLGSDLARQAGQWYGLSPEGDVEGRSVLRTWLGVDELAAKLELSPDLLESNIEKARQRLKRARDERTPPLRDEKIIVEWNGLMISAFARAGFALNEPRYLEIARRAAGFILENMRSQGRLQRIWLEGKTSGPAFLADYAFFIAALIDLYEASPNTRWIDQALTLQSILDAHYADPTGGYYRTSDTAEVLLARENPVRDGAVPSGNSVATLNLLRLAGLTSNPEYETRALQNLSSQGDVIRSKPTSVSELLLAVDFALDTPKEILLVKGSADDAEPLLDTLRRTFVPNRVISIVEDGEERKAHAKLIPLLRHKVAQRGKTTAYVCQEQVCKLPTSDPEIFAEELKRRP